MGQYNTREKYDRGVCPLQPPFLAVRGHVLGRIHVRRSFLCFNVLDNEESKGNCKIFNTETLSSRAITGCCSRSILPFKILRIDVQFQLLQGNDVEKPLDDKTSVDDDEKEPEPELKPFSMKKAYLLLPAALCDMLGTSTMYVALTLTSASSFQMLRGINSNYMPYSFTT